MRYFLETLKYRNEVLFYFGLACIVGAIFCAYMTRTTTIQVMNINAWIKPLKFCLSTALFSWAMGWYLGYLNNGPDIRVFNWIVVIGLGFEIVYIAMQASKGQLSHYNTSTAYHSGMFSLMALAATMVTLYTAYIGLKFATETLELLPDSYALAIKLGIFIFVVFSFQGFAMGANMAHTVGASDGTQGIPFLNWSLSKGDLRVAHFIGMHALQVLPVFAFYLLKNTKWVWAFAVVYGLLALVTLIQAFYGKPIFRG